MPENFAILGDAVISLNPVFGQGCSKAMIDAMTLDGALRAVTVKGRARTERLPEGFARGVVKMQMARVKSMFDLTRWMGGLLFTHGYIDSCP